MTDQEERRSWVLPPARGKVGGIELAHLDPANPDGRRLLILAEHPELRAAIDADEDEIELHGQTMNPRLHIHMHEAVANQLWDDNPPEVWQTVKRLRQLGYERHDILHMLASVVSYLVWRALKQGRHDHNDHLAALAALPGSWEAMREESPQRPPRPPRPARPGRPAGKARRRRRR